MPPKKSASAYIIFGKEVRILKVKNYIEKIRSFRKKSRSKSNRSSKGDSLVLAKDVQRRESQIQRSS